MRTPTRFMLSAIAAIALSLACAPTSRAGHEANSLLRAIPDDAPVALVVPDLSRLDTNSASMLGALEVTTASTLFQIMRVMGPFGAIEQTGAAAIVLTSLPNNAGDAWPAAIILPTRSFDEFARAMQALGEGPTRTITYNNSKYTISSAGESFVLIAPESAMVKPGAQQSFDLRALPADIASGADAFLVARGDALRTLARRQLDDIASSPSQKLLPVPIGKEELADARDRALALLDGADIAVLGTSFGPLGVKIEGAIAYAPGTAIARATSAPASEQVMREARAIPSGKFLAMFAGDLANPVVADALSYLRERAPNAAMFLRPVKDASTLSLTVYVPDTPLMIAGPMSKSLLRWNTDAASESLDAFRTTLKELNLKAADGTRVTVGHARAQQSHRGVEIDSISLTPAPGTGLFGSSPFVNAYAAASDTWCAVSIESDPANIRRIIDADAQDTLVKDPVVSQLLEFLPKAPSGIALLNVEPVIEQFRPFLMMMVQAAEIPPQLPPAAFATDAADGSTRITTFIPAPLLKLAFTLWTGTGGGMSSFTGSPDQE